MNKFLTTYLRLKNTPYFILVTAYLYKYELILYTRLKTINKLKLIKIMRSFIFGCSSGREC